MTFKLIERCELYVWTLGLIYYGTFVFYPELFHGKTHAEDPMSVVGFGFLLIGIVLARWVQRGFLTRIDAVFAGGAIHMPGMTREGLRDWFHVNTARYFLWIFLPLLGLYLIVLTATSSNELGKIHLYVGGALGIWMVSVRFAVGVATGLCATYVSGPQSRFVLNPAHSDRSSGFGRLGYFYFDQALVLLLPAVFMIFWIGYVAINLSTLERNEVANAVFDKVGIETREDTTLSQSLEAYVVCRDEDGDIFSKAASDCTPAERSFLWGPAFYALTIFNIIIFLLSWGLPTIRLRARMAEYRDTYISLKIDELERVLTDLRGQFFDRLDKEEPDPVVRDMQAHMDAVSCELGTYRATPTYPLPIWTALTAIISNLSAVFGLLGASLL